MIIIIIINAKNTVCCIRMIKIKYQIHTAKPTERPKVVGHDICEFVYFHIIVFCLDFHRGKLYLRKWGRKWNENKGKGKEPGVMEPTANWSRFSRRPRDGGTTAALRTLYLFTLNESTNVRPRSWVEGWLILGGGKLGGIGEQRIKTSFEQEVVVHGWRLHPRPPWWHRCLLWLLVTKILALSGCVLVFRSLFDPNRKTRQYS